MDRRGVLRAIGAGVTVGLAGCSGNGNGGTGNGGDSDSSGSSGGTETDTATPTENTSEPITNNEDQQERDRSELYEEDETEAEEQWETDTFNAGINDAWIEMENPAEQMPEENYDFEEFPNLQIFEEIDTYSSETEAVYLLWANTGDRVELGAFEVRDYEGTQGGTGTSGSAQYTDQSADVGRILEEVIEGVDDVSEDINDEYAEILLQY